MISKRRLMGFAAAALAAATVVAGCSSHGGKGNQGGGGGIGAGTANTPKITVAMITHGAPGDTFWDLIRQGADAAAKKDNVNLIYRGDPDATKQATDVQNVINQHVDGLAVTLASPDAMRGAVKDAEKANIPVVGFNQGLQYWQKMGIMSYFGQDETIAGNLFGKKLNDLGAQHQLCVIQQPSVALNDRCNGLKQTFHGQSTRLYVNGKDDSDMLARITSKLQQDPSIDYVDTLGAPVALIAVKAVQQAGSKAKVATFDTNKQLITAIKDGHVQFAIDQQPFLQGYLAVDSLWLYKYNGSVIGGGKPVLTGPSVIGKKNIGKIARYAKSGNR